MIVDNFNRNSADVPDYFDPVGDGKINDLDFGYVIKDWSGG